MAVDINEIANYLAITDKTTHPDYIDVVSVINVRNFLGNYINAGDLNVRKVRIPREIFERYVKS